MRRILNVNFLVVILFVAVILLLNYINFVPLSKILPFLSFLPHATQTKIINQESTPTSTPLPPFAIKKIDIANKSGEFVISNPTPKESTMPLTKQVLIDGTYNTDTKKITINATSEDSSIPVHPMPQGLMETSDILLRFEMIVDNLTIYQADIPLVKVDSSDIISFKTRLPFYSKATIKIYSGSSELFSQELNI